tara:strand:+ start:398 stop:712 length:315 start_codon:yes stop_codon:yes gene_type:complete
MGKRSNRKVSAKFLEAGKAWRAHLNEYREAHPKLSLKQQMKGAKKTYKKSKSTPSTKSEGVTIRTSKYDVKVKHKTLRATGKKTRRPKRKSSRKKRSTGLLGMF